MAESLYEVNVAEATEVRNLVNVTVAASLLDKDINRRLRQIAKTARIKGFRAGKVPMKIIRKRYAPSVRFDALNDLVNRAMPEVLRDERLHGTIHYSRPELLTGTKANEPVSFSFTAEHFSTVVLKGHEGIAVERVIAKVAEGAVDEALKKLQDDNTQIVPVEDRNVVEADDIVMVTYRALDDDADEIHAEEQQVDLSNEGLLPGLVEGIIGCEKGIPKEIKVQLPENFQLEELSGTEIELELTITEIKKKSVPAIDDELAKDAGEFETLDALKADIEAKLLEEATIRKERLAKRRMMDALLDANALTVPEGYLMDQAAREAEARLQQFRDQGLKPEDVGLTLETMIVNVKPEVSRGIHESLVLLAVVKAAGIHVSDEDIDAKLSEIAEQSGQPVARIRSNYNQPGMMDRLRTSLAFDRAVEWLWDKAEVTDVAELTATVTEGAPAEELAAEESVPAEEVHSLRLRAPRQERPPSQWP